VLRHTKAERLEKAREARKLVLLRQHEQTLPVEHAIAKRGDGEAWVREQDDHVHDLSAWD
jgi:hypothetical protein